MSCVEKRHVTHRVGSMLHHRFPNGFTDLFMDDTDREVSTLTDRAFRSLCVGDDAVYNDELLYGFSPFSCHKPLVGEPLKKTHHKESKKHGQKKCDKNNAEPWKQQQQKNMSNMTSFLKALSATEESCEGMLIKNGGTMDSNGESWDKSALRSIQKELSDFSTDYHPNLREGHNKNHHRHHSGGGSSNKTGKDAALPSGKSSKIKNGKTTVKLKKLNIKNFFLHSELSPFQSWRDFKHFPFGQEETVTSIRPTDNIPKWFDLPFYKELTDAHKKETLQPVEGQSCQKAAVEPPPPTAPKPIPPPPPPKVLPKPSATLAEKRCSSEGGDGITAPWRRNRSRATSAIPVNQPEIPSQESDSKTIDETLLLVKKEPKSVEVKAIEEVSSLASTPFSICQLMTPLIPSRQPTETSEILSVFSPSALDLPLRPHSEVKVTPEPPVKRESYKSLASSILFNLKDNRKRVKSRYSPPKFKTIELPDGGIQSPQSDHYKHPHASSEGNASGFSTPAIFRDDKVTRNIVAEEESDKTYRHTEEVNEDTEAVSETPGNMISPLLLVNGVSVNQSPPDQASLSSKSSYFSAYSALNRNTETGSNIYHSLENLMGEVEEGMQNVPQNTKHDLDRTEVEYYSLSDHESESEVKKRAIAALQPEGEVPDHDSKEKYNITADESLYQDEKTPMTPISPPNTFSPTLAIPSLFKIKDNTFNNKLKKKLQPWVLGGSLGGSERVEDQAKENPQLTLVNETSTSDSTLPPAETFTPKEIVTNHLPPLLLSPSNLLNEIPKKPQLGQFLTVQQEDDRLSGVSPSSEGVESVTTSTAEMGNSAGVPGEHDVSKVFSEGSGSTYSGNESQTGLSKPPIVLPKSDKAVLKAIKLTNRRIKKEEAQKSPNKSSQSSSKHRADRHKADKSEQKSGSSSKNSKSIERKHHHQSEDPPGRTNREGSEQRLHEDRANNSEDHHQDRAQMNRNTTRRSNKSADSNKQSKEELPSVATERQGRDSDRHVRDKPKRHYSTDRVISNVPVYKAQDSPVSDRPFQRSQSIDRYLGDKVERRLSADMSANERFDPRTQRIEKSIMDGIQQRGRARDKATRDNPSRRSQSIDAYSTEASHPPTLSRQSSYNSQFSRQSSIEHAIVAQSFPMTQRKLLQDPESGQYFFVDMPIQVKTKTFFDPETGSYVQLPVQPPEGAIPQASPMEVLTPPLVVYHSFVPVPLSPMAQKAIIQTAVIEPEEFDQRRLERSRQMHCREGHQYLEPVYGQHDHMLGEFMGTEELDCAS
ncbi:cardiac-enriched FHL2-interacting protein [Limanda limanda]|uniref:cardiac-enriched FHL2-interacting protein n=1 Tax=Limanda limanda TaxID=27771 RepID=UPI0029C6FDB7|nr:cardiac-enriched FHL2-interacting protein [Limanda limanda]